MLEKIVPYVVLGAIVAVVLYILTVLLLVSGS